MNSTGPGEGSRQRAHSKAPGLFFFFLNSPLKTQISKIKEAAKDLTSLALHKCLSSVGMKACPEHKASSTSQEIK